MEQTGITILIKVAVFVLINSLIFQWVGQRGVVASDSGTAVSLYPFHFPMIQMTADNFTDNVIGKSYGVFAQFYSSYCGHCIAFRPKWSKFIYDIKAWDRIVKPAGINCALSINRQLCADEGIEATPTILYFKSGARNSNDTIEYDARYSWTPHGLSAGLANIVAQDAGQMRHPIGWPRMKPIYALTTLYDLYQAASIRGADKVAIIFEEPGNKDYVGEQVTLDFSNINDVYVLTADHTHFLARDFQVNDYPGLILLMSNNSEPIFKSKFALTRNEIRAMIAEDFELDYTIYEPPSDLDGNDSDDRSFNASSVDVHRQDLLSGLSYMLRDEIANHRLFAGEKLEALKKFIYILANYFPGGETTMALLRFLNERFSESEPYHVTNITNAQWRESLDKLKNQFPGSLLDEPQWLACRGSKRRYRGYSCSLWLMFHSLTVEAFEAEQSNPSFDPLEVLKAIRDYVVNFFGCSTCAKHFSEETVAMEEIVRASRDAVLYLWRIHNRVNARLAGHGSEDPQFPKIQFPDQDDCTSCRRSDGTFDENEVFNYLLQHYGNIPIVKRKR